MPLNPKKSVHEMAKEMMAAGHPEDQSYAAAYDTKRKAGYKVPKKKAKKKGK